MSHVAIAASEKRSGTYTARGDRSTGCPQLSDMINSKTQRDRTPSLRRVCRTCLPAQPVVGFAVTVSAKQAGLGHCGHPFLPN